MLVESMFLGAGVAHLGKSIYNGFCANDNKMKESMKSFLDENCFFPSSIVGAYLTGLACSLYRMFSKKN